MNQAELFVQDNSTIELAQYQDTLNFTKTNNFLFSLYTKTQRNQSQTKRQVTCTRNHTNLSSKQKEQNGNQQFSPMP